MAEETTTEDRPTVGATPPPPGELDATVSGADVARESAFAERTAALDTREVVPGRLGHGRVVAVDLGDETDRFVCRGPAGESVTVALDATPASTAARPYAFFDAAGVDPTRQLDAVGATLPFAYDDEDERWVPVFPRQNTALAGLSFRFSRLLARGRLSAFVPTGSDGDPSPRFSTRAPVDVAAILLVAAVATLLSPYGAVVSTLPALVAATVCWLSVVALTPLYTPVSTVAPLDERSPDA